LGQVKAKIYHRVGKSAREEDKVFKFKRKVGKEVKSNHR